MKNIERYLQTEVQSTKWRKDCIGEISLNRKIPDYEELLEPQKNLSFDVSKLKVRRRQKSKESSRKFQVRFIGKQN